MRESAIQQLIECIQSCDILPDDAKPDVIRQILIELEISSVQVWFNCKMILYKNRYDIIEKDDFLKQIGKMHLRELVEYGRSNG